VKICVLFVMRKDGHC